MGKVDCIVEMRKEEYEKGFVKGYVDGYVVSIVMPIVMETLLTEGYSTNDIFRYREILKNKFKNREI